MRAFRNGQSGRLIQDLQREDISNKSGTVQNHQRDNFPTGKFIQREDFGWI